MTEELLSIIAERNDKIIYQIDKLTTLIRLLLILNVFLVSALIIYIFN